MAALTANVETMQKETEHVVEVEVKSSTTIYKGAAVCADASGYAVPAADAAGLKTMGVAAEVGDNATGADGDLAIRLLVGVSCFNVSGLTKADIGADVYWADDNTVQAAGSVLAGKLVAMEGSAKAWIRIH